MTTDKYIKDASKLLIPVGWIGGIASALILCGAAYYRGGDNTANIEDHEQRIRPLEIQTPLLHQKIDAMADDIREIKEMMKR